MQNKFDLSKPMVCPHCSALSLMLGCPGADQPIINTFGYQPPVVLTYCLACRKPSLWVSGELKWPTKQGIQPHEHLPERCRQTFMEAQKISSISPRAACALLRVTLEQLVDELLGAQKDPAPRKNLNERIKSLPCSHAYQDLCDACRIVGNKAAHPAEISFEEGENEDLPLLISELINAIVASQISPAIIAKEALSRVRK